MKPLVIYHADCRDGFCAAWVARRAMGDCEFVPMQYGQPMPYVEGRRVFVLDFSFPRDVMIDAAKLAESFVCLDHHKTAAAVCEGLSFCKFDMNKSGARLAWEHFFGNEKSPWLVDYTEDRDLWRWWLFESKEINAGLRMVPLDFMRWEGLHNDSKARDFLARDGRVILAMEQMTIAKHVERAAEIEMDGHRVLCVNATTLVSEIGEALARNRPFGVVWSENGDGDRLYSLRSTDAGIDVSEIAKRRGGGGHRNAAGFKIKRHKNDHVIF